MILAAGFGKRLRPISDVLPKALLPLEGRTLLEWNLRWLASEGIEHAVLNAHHLSSSLTNFVADETWNDPGATRQLPVEVLVETEILGTAGGLGNAASHLTGDPVLVLNMDQLFRAPLDEGLARHRAQSALATLFLAPDARLAQVRIECDRVIEILERPDPGDPSLWAFTGVYWLSREALEDLPHAGFAELGPYLREWARAGRLAATFVESRPFREIGTPEAYADLLAELRGPARKELGVALLGVALPDRAPKPVTNAEVFLGAPERLLRRAEPEDRAIAERLAEETLPADDTAAFPLRCVWPLAGDGSSRRLLRVARGRWSRIVVRNPTSEVSRRSDTVYPRRRGPGVPDENETYVNVSRFLASSGVPVPSIHRFDPVSGTLVLDDLGDTLLFDCARAVGWTRGQTPRDSADVGSKYSEAIDLLLRMQRAPGFDPASTMNLPYDRGFVLEFEVGYFHREMVRGHAGLELDLAEMEGDYHAVVDYALAGRLRGFLHRDFQSRNLMATPRGLVVIDFQGARLGPPEYDLASLLFDPYVMLPFDLQEELIERYLRTTGTGEDRHAFGHRLRAVAICRLMQALGAFAYLGGTLGKTGFLEHAPTALERLRDLCGGHYPKLSTLAARMLDLER